jgi:lipopolysaccharide export system permease protein
VLFRSVLVIYAKSGTYDAGKWTLDGAWAYQMDGEGRVVSARSRKQVVLNLRAEFGQVFAAAPPEALTTARLRQRIAEKHRQNLPAIEDEVMLQFKYSVPLACLALAFICPVLALVFSRGGSFVGVLLSIVLVFVYWNTLLLFRILGTQGVVPPLLAAWTPNLIFGAAGLALMRRSE